MRFVGNFTEWRRKKGETDPEQMWEFVRDFTRSASGFITNDRDAWVELEAIAKYESDENTKVELNYID